MLSSPMESSFLLNSASKLATKLSSFVDPNFLCKFDFNDDFLLPSLEEEELRLLELLEPVDVDFKPMRALPDNFLMDPLEHSTSSENDTLEFLDDFLDDEDEDD